MVERVYICQQIGHGRHVGQTCTVILFEKRMRTTNSELISLGKISVKFSLLSPLVTLETYSTPRRAILKQQHLFMLKKYIFKSKVVYTATQASNSL